MLGDNTFKQLFLVCVELFCACQKLSHIPGAYQLDTSHAVPPAKVEESLKTDSQMMKYSSPIKNQALR
jgi:hypothetical protein